MAAAADGILSPANEELAEVVAHQLLARWGVVTWELWGRESFKVPWREVVWALRRLEARGLVLGGRFVAGLSGEQYALPEAAEDLLAVHRRPADGEEVVVAGADPLNLTGSILGGTRVPHAATSASSTATAWWWTRSGRGERCHPRGPSTSTRTSVRRRSRTAWRRSAGCSAS